MNVVILIVIASVIQMGLLIFSSNTNLSAQNNKKRLIVQVSSGFRRVDFLGHQHQIRYIGIVQRLSKEKVTQFFFIYKFLVSSSYRISSFFTIILNFLVLMVSYLKESFLSRHPITDVRFFNCKQHSCSPIYYFPRSGQTNYRKYIA